MFNLQGSEIIVILLIAVVVLGPEKLPDAIRRFSQTYAELKKMGSGFQSELKSALDEPVREMRETANMVRDAADPDKIAASAASDQPAAASDQPAAASDQPAAASDQPAAASDQPAADGAAAQPAGDPPLGEPPPEDGPLSPAEPTARINHIAAANSSGAIAAATADRAGDSSVETVTDGAAVTDAPTAPRFHSAAPKPTGAARPDHTGSGEGGTSDGGTVDGGTVDGATADGREPVAEPALDSIPAGNGPDDEQSVTSTDEAARA